MCSNACKHFKQKEAEFVNIDQTVPNKVNSHHHKRAETETMPRLIYMDRVRNRWRSRSRRVRDTGLFHFVKLILLYSAKLTLSSIVLISSIGLLVLSSIDYHDKNGHHQTLWPYIGIYIASTYIVISAALLQISGISNEILSIVISFTLVNFIGTLLGLMFYRFLTFAFIIHNLFTLSLQVYYAVLVYNRNKRM